MNEQAAAEKAGFKMTPFGMGNENMALSDAPCIDSDSGDEFAQTFAGIYNQNFSSSIKVYNTLTHIIYEFGGAYNCAKLTNFDGSVITLEGNQYKIPLGDWKHGDQVNRVFWVGRNGCTGIGNGQAVLIATSYTLIGICTETTLSAGTTEAICEGDPFTLTASVAADGDFTGGFIQILDAGANVVSSAAVTAENKSVTYSGPWDTEGSYSFSAQYVPNDLNGYKASIGGPSIVEVKKCDTCDAESFTYEATNQNLDVVFSYNYKEATSVTLTFTLPQTKIVQATGTTYYGADGKAYIVGGNGTNLTWTGDVSCSKEAPTTFSFNFAADCGPNTANDGKANIWTQTDVKAINGVTLVDDPNTLGNEGPYGLRGGLDTIVYSGCPTK